MNERIKELINLSGIEIRRNYDENGSTPAELQKFAELIVRACADAADMAYDARCSDVGDYVGEQLGYGEEHGITAWRHRTEE
jgi:hypothetical protein